MASSYKWKPISDLPEDFAKLTDGELPPLHRVWEELREALEKAGGLEHFSARLHREWAIETGIIEGVYALDRGITQTLIEHGLDADRIPREATNRDPELVARIIQDHADALEEMFAFVKGERGLTTGYIKELHAALLRNQNTFTAVDQFGTVFEKELDKGQYKNLPNNPTRPDGLVHEYCPPEQVAAEMDRMMQLHEEHVAKHVPVEVEAAWLHHVFTQIHPFEDGNGRVARALATLIFIKDDWFPVIVTRDDRERYIDALEIADGGELLALVNLFVRTQRRAAIQAVTAVEVPPVVPGELDPARTPEDAIAAARDALVKKGQIPPQEWMRAKETALRLFNVGLGRFNAVARRLTSEISRVQPKFKFSPVSFGPDVLPIVESVYEHLGYLINLNDCHACGLSLATARRTFIALSFCSVGAKYHGVILGTVFVYRDNGAPEVVAGDIFQVNYQEDPAHTEQRFRPWLERALTEALARWQRTL